MYVLLLMLAVVLSVMVSVAVTVVVMVMVVLAVVFAIASLTTTGDPETPLQKQIERKYQHIIVKIIF